MYADQKALLLKEPFGDLVLDKIPIPVPGKGEILIKIQAASLNPIDWKIQKFNILTEKFPIILGKDISGTVEAVGEGVSDFKIGDRVICPSEDLRTRAGFQQYVSVLTETVSKIPTALTFEEAVTLPLALSTAYSGLYAASPRGLSLTPPTLPAGLGKYTGYSIVIIGGAGSVGQCAIQLSRMSGLSHIITTASLTHTDALQRIGATHVLDRNMPVAELRTEISKITPNVDFVFDCVVSPSTQQIAVDIMSPRTHVVFATAGKLAVSTEGINASQVLGTTRGAHNLELFKSLYHDHLYDWLDKGLIVPNQFEVLSGGLAGVEKGLKRLQEGKVLRVKLVVRPQETRD